MKQRKPFQYAPRSANAVHISFTVHPHDRALLDAIAGARDTTLSTLVREALALWVNHEEIAPNLLEEAAASNVA